MRKVVADLTVDRLIDLTPLADLLRSILARVCAASSACFRSICTDIEIARRLIEYQKGGINKQGTAADVANTANALNASAITGGALWASRGGIGTTNGIVMADGAGNASAAVAGTDYVKPEASLQATPTNPQGQAEP